MMLPPHARPIDPARVDSLVLEAFSISLVSTFGELCSTSVSPGEPVLLDAPISGDVAASLVLRGEPAGLLVLVFPLPVLRELVIRYLAGSAAPTDSLVEDAAGEFANVLAGQAKTMLKGTPHHYQLSLPRVIRNSTPEQPPAGPYLSWICTCDAGSFALQLAMPGPEIPENPPG